MNTYRVWLRHELFQGKLTNSAFEASEKNLDDFIMARSNADRRNSSDHLSFAPKKLPLRLPMSTLPSRSIMQLALRWK